MFKMSARAEELYLVDRDAMLCWTDRLFAGLMVVQWLACILSAVLISPLTWIGTQSQVHPHIWAAVVFGGSIALLPLLLAWQIPGRPVTRHVVAVAQMLFGGLLIHLTGGRIETHFHVFGSLAFLAFYRDWRVLLTGTIVVTADHLTRGHWWPLSIFGDANAGSWRWLEHAGWVVFLDIFLITVANRSNRDLRIMAGRQAERDAIKAAIEATIEERTRQLDQATVKSERLAEIARRTSNAVIITDAEGKVEWVNEGFTRISGYRLDEVAGRKLGHLLQGPRSDPAAVARMRDAVRCGTPAKVEITNYAKDGRAYVLRIEILPLHAADGTLSGFMAIESDITAHCESIAAMLAAKASAETAWRESEALRSTLNEYAIVSVADVRGRILEINSALCTISGYSREELLGKDHRILNSGEHPPSFWSRMWKTIHGGTAWRGEVCNRAKDGRLYWVDSIIAPFNGPDGNIEKYVSIRFDITAQKAAEAELVRTTKLLEEAQGIARTGNWSLDLATGQITWSKQVFINFGRNEADGPPDHAGVLSDFAPDDALRLDRAVTACSVDGLAYNLTLRTSGRNPAVRHLQAAGRARRDPAGRVIALFGTVTDCTAEIEREQSLLVAQARAESASRAKSEFLANMSHEIRTPLTSILGFADLLADDACMAAKTNQRLQIIDTIKSAGAHLLTVINDILDLSKIEADKLTLEQIDFSLVQVLREVESMMRPRAIHKGIVLNSVLGTPVPEFIVSDPTRVRQILINLAGNAVKFTDAGSVTISTSTVSRDGRWRLSIDVRDTGPGVRPEQQELLFLAFSQADNAVTRKHGGTGLGLTISRRLAEMMGGTVTLVSTQLGRGSCFRVELPLEPVAGTTMIATLEAVQDHAASAAAAVPETLSGRVLLAEDGEDNQRLVVFHLHKAGAEVEVAENGRVALEMLNAAAANGQGFDLLLTDMQMPEMDGYTLARILRAAGCRIPIVALTAHAMAEDRQKSLDAGCDDYASKPINKAALIATCRQWIERGRGEGAGGAAPVAAASSQSDDNTAMLRSELADDPDMAGLVDKFLSNLEPKVRQVTEHLVHHRLDELGRLAHQIKGAGGGYGFPSISDAARAVEHHARIEPDLEQLRFAVGELSRLCARAAAGRAAPVASRTQRKIPATIAPLVDNETVEIEQ